MTPPSMRKSLPVINAPSGAHEQRADGSDFVRRAGAPGRGQLDHAPVPSPRGPVSSSLASGVMMMPGLIVLTRAPRLPQRTASAITRSEFPRLASLVGVERIGHLVGLEHRKSEQLVGGCRRQRLVLLGGQRRQAMPGLRCDDDAGTAARDDIAELLEHQRGAIQIDREDRRRRGLRGGDAGGVDDAR